MIVQQSPPAEGILLMHGDDCLRDFCRECLKRHGMHAVEAADEFDAVLIAASRTRPVRFFITDRENASISGIEMTLMLRAISPEIRMVDLSGTGDRKRKAGAEIRRLSETPARRPEGDDSRLLVARG